MIPVATKATEVDNLIGMEGEEEVQFTIGNVGLVMRSLSKLYSNAILAVIREYSTNARDAHIESGNTDQPIKVTLPTLMHPYFEIEDFGIGMTKETLKEVYTKFGDSTKRETNDQNGMLGYGCKSALAYADSFVVTSRKDGVETQAMIVRKPDWSISLRVTAQTHTNKPNGTKVQIPARDYDAFARIASDFYRFWIPGTVEVDGACPEQAVGEKLDDNLYFSKQQGTSYVVMGNVAYRITNPDALFRNRGMNSISFVAYVPNGSVEFTPSREDLEYTDHTKATLHGVIENFEKKVVAQAKADINSATDYFDAYTKYTYWSNKLGKGPFGDLEFKGEKFIDEIPIIGFRYYPREQRYNMYTIKSWSVSAMSNTMIVTGMPHGTPSSHHKTRSKQYKEAIHLTASYILFTTADTVNSVWIDKSRVVSWDTVREATKPPKKPKDPNAISVRRLKGTYDYADCGVDSATGNYSVKWHFEKPVPDTKNLYYISVQDDKNYDVSKAMHLLQDDIKIVLLSANRINKFKRDNQHVKSWVDEYKKKVNLNGIDLLDKSTRESLSIGHETQRWLNALNVNDIDDPEFKRIKMLLEEDSNKRLKAYNDAFALAVAMQMRYNFKEHQIRRSDDSLIDRYPLLKTINHYNFARGTINECVLYINAKYAAVSGKKGN